MMNLKRIFENIYLFKDVVNVYAIKDDDKAILIDFGSGRILDHLSEIGIEKVDYIFHTHYHRDQCFGDKIALESNIKIAAPEEEKKLFLEAEKFWKTRSYYDIYIFKPTFFVSTYNIPLELTFKDGDVFKWGSFELKIIETKGHSSGSLSYLLDVNGETLAFTGDLIHSGGKTLNYYDLEYNYFDNGMTGVNFSLKSLDLLMRYNPKILLPSHGDIIQEPEKDVEILKKNFERAKFVFSGYSKKLEKKEYYMEKIKLVNLKKEFPHIIHRNFSPPFIIFGNHQNCFLIDYIPGGPPVGFKLRMLKRKMERRNVENIDFIIPTHYHDDHVGGIPLLKQKFDVKVYAFEKMVDILENPTHYRLGCLMEAPIKVDKVFKEGDILRWDDYEFQIYHFPGQTEYHMGLFGEIDGKSVFFVGDSLSTSMLVDRSTSFNHVNLCRFGDNVGFKKCADILLKCNPEYVAVSHEGIFKADMELLERYKEIVSEYEPTITSVAAQEDPNMAFDQNWLHFKPIRINTKPGKSVKTNLVVRNYLKKESKIEFELNLPKGWDSDSKSKTYSIEPETFKEIPVSIKIPNNVDPNGRTMITANIIWNGTDLGPYPDLMIDHGYEPISPWKGIIFNDKSSFITLLETQIKANNYFLKSVNLDLAELFQ